MPMSISSRPIIVAAVALGAAAFVALSLGSEIRIARDLETPRGQRTLVGRMLEDGPPALAADVLRRLAEGGDPQAQYWLGHMLENGIGTPRNVSAAVDWYEKARSRSADASLRVGEMMLRGDTIPPDYAKAYERLRAAATQGSADAAKDLGDMNHLGLGRPVDDAEAYAWYEVALLGGAWPAVERRDALARHLTPAQQAEAQNRARELVASLHLPR
ncbi:MAG: sel1 repeat family protein [Alphaproteobacteria bacterium]|nr:sel1 repeat family protein [Alphaproteobacteria bacterium]